jgi:hypothetical protein
MPARKPSSLNAMSTTKEERSKRESAESAMTPRIALNTALPLRLRGRGHTNGAAAWKQAMKTYASTDSIIATAFDTELLVNYCLAIEEAIELADLRAVIILNWKDSEKALKKIKKTADNLKEWTAMQEVVNGFYMRIQGMDARLDGKKKLILAMQQSLYLTPRSRAGVAPTDKEPEHDDDPMAALLNE